MGKPPAVVVIARHGARLDAADDQWHTTSPTPYDTPLSYGGWTQTRALGARIASLLHARDLALADEHNRSKRRNSDVSPTSPVDRDPSRPASHKARRHKVVIHSSPFVRCIQSSIAISAGMAQYHGNLHKFESHQPPPSSIRRGSAPIPTPLRAQTLDSKTFEERLAGKLNTRIQPPVTPQDDDPPSGDDPPPPFEKSLLRIDACLGEWLSPDYFEFVTAPPPSNMMVAAAKAELLRSADPLQGAKIVQRNGSVTVFPGQEPARKPSQADKTSSGSFSVDDLRESLPRHGSDPDLSTQDSVDPVAAAKDHGKQADPFTTGYIAPTPTYALLHSAPIPNGYVAHARDACVRVDFQWDSMREPQNWGDGGSYGEEWSSMHRRFRNGIFNMVNWYKQKGPDYDPQDAEDAGDESKGADDDADVILVLVTHGAGCNALIGALTNQPVLMDVGMGSLTMATRKTRSAASATSPHDSGASVASPTRRRRSSSVDVGLPDEYDMKLIASTDHLRAGADPLHIPQLMPPGSMPSIAEVRSRSGTASSGTASPAELDRPRSKNSALGSIRRTTARSSSSRTYSPSPILTSPTASGLWGSRSSTLEEGTATTQSPLDNFTLDFKDGSQDKNSNGNRGTSVAPEEKSDTAAAPSSAEPSRAGSGRLWGAGREQNRPRAWTVGARQ